MDNNVDNIDADYSELDKCSWMWIQIDEYGMMSEFDDKYMKSVLLGEKKDNDNKD